MKTPILATLLPAAAAVLLAAACSDSDYTLNATPAAVQGNGNVVEESRPIGAFSGLDFRGVGTVYIEQGARQQLQVRAEENLIDHLRTDVQSGELVIWKDAATLVNTRPIEYHLTVVDLDRVRLAGAGQIEASDLDTGPLALQLSGVGGVELVNLQAPSLDVESTGVGDLNLSGSVQEQTVRLRNMGEYDARHLTSNVADVLVANWGSATVRVRDRLRVRINGSGSVYYIGDPIVDSSGSGSGDVVQIGG
jgi:hypothetical protein